MNGTETSTMAGLAVLGKTAAALAFIIGLILLGAWLVKRLRLHRQLPGQNLRLVSTLPVGQRERVVVVELEETWLVLGVGGGQVNKLHELPARPAEPRPMGAAGESGFSARFGRALQRQLAQGGK